MLTLNTLSTIESLLMSKSHPAWGEFLTVAQAIGEIQAEKQALLNAAAVQRVQPTPLRPVQDQEDPNLTHIVSG